VVNWAILHTIVIGPGTKKKIANNIREEVDFEFTIQDGVYSKTICKCIMYSGTTIHMTPHWAIFNTFEGIASQNAHLDDDSIVEASEMDSIVVDVMVKDKTKKLLESRMSSMCLNGKPICFW